MFISECGVCVQVNNDTNNEHIPAQTETSSMCMINEELVYIGYQKLQVFHFIPFHLQRTNIDNILNKFQAKSSQCQKIINDFRMLCKMYTVQYVIEFHRPSPLYSSQTQYIIYIYCIHFRINFHVLLFR